MTYQEIISQVSQRLGHKAFAGELKANYRYAVKWAEQEIMSDSKPTKNAIEVQINPPTVEYRLPDDWGEPEQIICLDQFNQKVEYQQISYSEWMQWDPSQSAFRDNDFLDGGDRTFTFIGDLANPDAVVQDARLRSKVAIAFNSQPSGYYLSVKPAFTGKIQIYYPIVPNLDIFENLKRSPIMPLQFHRFIIPGAVYYLAQIDMAQAKSKGDVAGLQFFGSLMKSANEEFINRKHKVKEKVNDHADVMQARPFSFYENPRRYR